MNDEQSRKTLNRLETTYTIILISHHNAVFCFDWLKEDLMKLHCNLKTLHTKSYALHTNNQDELFFHVVIQWCQVPMMHVV